MKKCVCVCVCSHGGGGGVLIFLQHEKGTDGEKKSFLIPVRVFIYSDANIKLNAVNGGIVDTESVRPLSCSAIFGMVAETANLTHYIR